MMNNEVSQSTFQFLISPRITATNMPDITQPFGVLCLTMHTTLPTYITYFQTYALTVISNVSSWYLMCPPAYNFSHTGQMLS
jgi:hypothetical protein